MKGKENNALFALSSRRGFVRARESEQRQVFRNLNLPALESPMTQNEVTPKSRSSTDLDRPEIYLELDPSGMRRRLCDVPGQCLKAWRQAGDADLKGLGRSYDKVVISGMGGSAIAGDLAADLSSRCSKAPLVVVRSLNLPFALDQNTLFISCSHSGNTGETLSLFQAATSSPVAVMAITGGGLLAEKARDKGIPIVPVESSGEPRSAMAYNLMLLLGVLSRLGLFSVNEEEVLGAAATLKNHLTSLAVDVPTEDNPAKQLAAQLVGRMLLIFGGDIFSGAARRWKAQLNENAKTWAFYENIPECLHNSVESFGAGSATGRDIFALSLQPRNIPRELEDRYRVLTKMLERSGVANSTLVGVSGSPLAQVLCMTLLGDYVSYYLAILKGLDPSPTPAIDLGKS